MRRVTFALGLAASLLVVQPAFATTVSLQSILINEDGALYSDETVVPGVNTAGWSGVTGEGTLSFVFNGGPGAHFFDVFFDHQLSVPFFNEYGTVNGAPAAGTSYEIGDSFASNIFPDVTLGGSLPNSNSLFGQASNFANNCVGANCNGDFAAALGYAFILGAGEQAVITLNVGETNPGGFSLQGTHPQDPGGPAVQLFISGNVRIQPIDGNPTPVPEPSSLYLLVTATGPVLWKFRRRLSGN